MQCLNAGSRESVSSRSRHPAGSAKLRSVYQGRSFFDSDKWDFQNIIDPTHGMVNYVDKATAVELGLVEVLKNDSSVISIDRTSRLAQGGYRNSVRLSSVEMFNVGSLIIADFGHSAWGCSVWPAFW